MKNFLVPNSLSTMPLPFLCKYTILPTVSYNYVKEKGKSSTDKIEGPACIIAFLGITLNTLQMELRLPEEIQRLKSLIEEWSSKRWCKKRDLLFLIGHLAK